MLRPKPSLVVALAWALLGSVLAASPSWAQSLRVKSGSYVGDGVNGRPIAGLGFQPDVVIVKADADQNAVIRTSTMTGNVSKSLFYGVYPLSDRIQSLDADGFTVGNTAPGVPDEENPQLNAPGVTYYWVAFQAAPGEMKVGTYVGNDVDDRDITGVGFQPEFVLVFAEADHWPWYRFASMAGDTARTMEGGAPPPGAGANRIQTFLPDGFQLGNDIDVNDGSPATTYHYIAWKSVPGRIAIGSYTGNGVGQTIGGVGFEAEYLLVSRDTNSNVHKPASTGVNTDTTQYFGGFPASSNAPDLVQALLPDGFRVGSTSDVNGNGITFRFVAFGPHAPQTNYRSIGTATDTLGTLNATQGSDVVSDPTATWRTANRGRGDRIGIGGTDYTVLVVESQTQLRLTQPFAGTSGSYAYTISRQFATLAAWEDCIDGLANGGSCAYFPPASNSLVSDDRSEVGILYADGSSYAGGLVIDGSVTDAAHAITLTADGGNRHDGIPGAGAVIDNAVGVNPAIHIADDYATVEWMEIRNGGGGGAFGIYVNGVASGGATRLQVRNNLIHDLPTWGIGLDDTDLVIDVYNNIVYSCNIGIRIAQDFQAWSQIRVFNNTLYGNTTYGVNSSTNVNSQQITLRNNLAALNGTDFTFDVSGAPNAASSHNLSTDTTADDPTVSPGGFALISQNVDTQVRFVDRAGGDLHLQGTSTAIDAGADLSSVFSWDVDLQSRPWGAQWDIGADERPPTGSCSVGQLAWYDPDWSFRKEVAIDSTKVAGVLSDFPVLINLASDPELAAEALDPGGDDILFTAADGITKLSHEIEKFDGGTGELVAWVKVPYLSSGADTTIFMYYGNPAAGNQEDAAGVWSAGFLGVFHLHDDFLDSTGVNPGTDVGGSLDSVGRIADAQDFDGSTQSVFIAGLLGSPAQVTLSAWVNQDTDNSQQVVSIGEYAGLRVTTAAGVKGYFYRGGGSWPEVTSGIPVVGTGWRHVAYSVRANAQVIYVDGQPRNSAAQPEAIVYSGLGTDSSIAKHATSATRFFDGDIDEVRVSGSVRSPEWIETEYNNQSDPVTFYTLCTATTEVELASFVAEGRDGAVELTWETASELDNLGFHLYRSTSGKGRYERITAKAIPGLGSSPVGAKYAYRDEGLGNGVTYYYKLEDIETTGKTTFHGPVWATPGAGASPEEPKVDVRSDDDGGSLITYGDPSATSLKVVERSPRGVTLELDTGGFYAFPQEDGSVRLEIPGFDVLARPGLPAIPIERTWVEAIAGRKVDLVSVTARQVESVSGLHPSNGETPEIVATQGTVRAARRRRSGNLTRGDFDGVYPSEAAWVAAVGFQEDVKKAQVEFAPLRWDASARRLLVARRLVVRLSFQGRDRNETPTDGVRGRRYRRAPQRNTVVARLVTSERGLHRIGYRELWRRGGLGASGLRLSRQGEPVPFHLEPSSRSFGPGSTLYFLGEGAASNAYGNEAVYELELGSEGERMWSDDSPPSGETTGHYWHRLAREENRLYQAALVDAPDLWLWDLLLAPVAKSYSFEVSGLASSSEPSRLAVKLQGTSSLPADPDHHVRVHVNGTLVAESRWDGKRSRGIDVELATGLLREGENVLELENVGDTEAAYSMVMLDRFEVLYPRVAVADGGKLEGFWGRSGIAELMGFAPDALVLDVTDGRPGWLSGREVGADGALRFRAEAGRRYLAVNAETVLHPDVRNVPTSGLLSERNQADYLVIAPRAFLPAAQPLLELRRSQGLRVKAVSIEDVYSSFGFGEPSPRAVKSFLSYAYHQWQTPSPRYVVLLGDATYDFKDYLGTGVTNRVPPWMVKTTYLWTASDPTYAAVNGEDLLPDLAIGRLPAAAEGEARAMVDKIVAYETGDATPDGPTVLIADNPDRAGDFEADAEEIAASLLASRNAKKIFLAELGPAASRDAIRAAFDGGSSLMSYLGHGGIHLWADENLLDLRAVASLSPQVQQPLLLTMNCLNGYFHFPYFNSLAEELLKQPDKGAIAAFSPSGLSLDAPAHQYHKALLKELFSGNHERLGDAVLAAQADYADSGSLPELLSIYHLLGDPALRLRWR